MYDVGAHLIKHRFIIGVAYRGLEALELARIDVAHRAKIAVFCRDPCVYFTYTAVSDDGTT